MFKNNLRLCATNGLKGQHNIAQGKRSDTLGYRIHPQCRALKGQHNGYNALQFIQNRHYAALSGRIPIIYILTQGVASLALGYVVLAFQTARRTKYSA